MSMIRASQEPRFQIGIFNLLLVRLNSNLINFDYTYQWITDKADKKDERVDAVEEHFQWRRKLYVDGRIGRVVVGGIVARIVVRRYGGEVEVWENLEVRQFGLADQFGLQSMRNQEGQQLVF